MAISLSWPKLFCLLSLSFLPVLCAAASTKGSSLQHEEKVVHDDDFVVALGSSTTRLTLAQSTRSYRAGMRTLIMTDNETMVPHLNKVYGKYREVYEYFPDEDVPDVRKWHAKNPGDYRAAVAPFAAHRQFGDKYKWMLYGDDDTVFFMPGVRKLVAQFDHNLPIALSDNLWHDSSHPRLEAVRCLPCGFNTSLLRVPSAKNTTDGTPAAANYTPRPACPFCTPVDACPPWKPECKGGGGAHGGAGIILSVGLMRKLLYDDAIACMESIFHCSGGDCLVSRCIWRAGYGFTDPGLSLMYDDPYDHILFDSLASRWFLHHPIEQIYLGNCVSDICSYLVRNVVSFHLRGKSYPSYPKAAAAMYGLVESHAAALDFLNVLEDTESRPPPVPGSYAAKVDAAVEASVEGEGEEGEEGEGEEREGQGEGSFLPEPILRPQPKQNPNSKRKAEYDPHAHDVQRLCGAPSDLADKPNRKTYRARSQP
ncbi:hypothetical protein VOLCADRAFT_90525 [Volvox carteri f. nagariensis]|uniref:Uncharacterized protein n=1 Tax=Volvox carteri f. nagariensis TaxID=3068 RepID=D8TUM2_VOLCA|nr:uncharacterized protein VOLCADRAFT_90525 [Volvox carteri f. nagariensis]EFJ48850.1 hypothetical protein VOLCADRAFT_90525 [Volvox carteri f. nagariensis]|eukprot:XP_002950182.1 hypothetical protein VOLCADRAFT_90525 [Volvox carteri f. nagariensis]